MDLLTCMEADRERFSREMREQLAELRSRLEAAVRMARV